MEMPLGRIMPHSIEAEQSVLGSMVMDNEAVATAAEFLKSDDFYREDHRVIFEAMIDLFAINKPIDFITLTEQLKLKGALDSVGGIEYLTVIATAVPAITNVKYYSAIVEEKSLLRKLIKAASEIANTSFEAADEVASIMEQAEKKIFNIIQNKNSQLFVPIKDILLSNFDKLEQLYKNKNKIIGVPTGFIDLDKKTAGLHPSDLILIAARPAMGKTSFVLNVAQHAAMHANIPVAVFSLEMSKEQLINRMLWSEALVDSQRMRTGEMEDDDWPKLARVIGPLSEAPIYIDDTPGISAIEIRAKCRRLKMEKDLGLIVIDYLQLMESKGRVESRQQEISAISRSLKILAKELNVPVVALSQLSRAPEARSDHRPILSDLRESGAIEQDADIVMFLYRDDYYNPDTEKKNVAECIIAKHRNGSTGTIELQWIGQFTKFRNLDKFHN